ncbi:hypothetical protein BT96DRAFT_1005301 [Gymnopus androsaceus JB14]|uniref:Pre-mRNA-splicing factor Syf1-like N-terminal HAT-repeats domain-containing protein n=1 Tax=Gymnopus androsaceus JB14 TaxID=1447944 RepID=A0A6A4GPU1_9AGAR|nr:hypothetical protein BT96DRAFT_1005301 [Gymnopus androsaceus JB14]
MLFAYSGNNIIVTEEDYVAMFIDIDSEDFTTRIKLRVPAAIQITAEQLLREVPSPIIVSSGHAELFPRLKNVKKEAKRIRGGYQENKRKHALQNKFARSHSVYERALDVDPQNIQLWLSYTEMELKSRNVQHSRNLFNQAVTLLPRVDQLWYKDVYLEELLQNVPGTQQVFERWMQWEPNDKAWQAHIKTCARA